MSRHPSHLLGMAMQALDLVAIAPDLETAKRGATDAVAAINEYTDQSTQTGIARGRLALPTAGVHATQGRRLGRSLTDVMNSLSSTPPMGGSGVPDDGAAAPGGITPVPAPVATPTATPSSLPAITGAAASANCTNGAPA